MRPYFGLRIGGIYVHRSFLPPLDQEPEHYGAPVPGAALGLTIAPMRHLRLGLEGRINIFKYAPDDGTEPRDLGYFEGIFTVGLAL